MRDAVAAAHSFIFSSPSHARPLELLLSADPASATRPLRRRRRLRAHRVPQRARPPAAMRASTPAARAGCPTLLPDRAELDAALDRLHDADALVAAPAVDAYCAALDGYLELAALLDPLLPRHIPALCALTRARLAALLADADATATHAARLAVELPARALYTLVKVRGPKRVAAHLPHRVDHLRALVPLLARAETRVRVHRFWHVRYVLYIWLSVAVRVPFPLRSILPDPDVAAAVDHAHAALSDTGPVADAATAFLARLLARRDAVHFRLRLVRWALQHALTPAAEPPVRSAGLALLASAFKHAHRDDMYPHVHPVLDALPPLVSPVIAPTTTDAHLTSKLSHRLALTFLPPRPAAWRYTRALPRLLARTPAGHVGPVQPTTQATLAPRDADALESVIDLLLTALQHRDTVVRWSAAKGVARITARLPLQLARDVVDAVLAVFDDAQQARSDAAWHGACLALAELARRGLLLPADDHFALVFDAVRRAAQFDVRRGANSVGAHVRDAACYAVWAVARAYAQEDVASYAPVIAQCMVPLVLLDREVNCRRAAAAALQECVGRLSTELFADGIKLITLAEYFALGDRNAAYLTIAPEVAQLGGGVYFDSILAELWSRKLVHWDAAVRSLSARALAAFVSVDKRRVIIRDVIVKLVHLATQKGDMVFRHGAVLGLAELARVVGLAGLSSMGSDIRQIPKLLKEKRLLTGRTGDDMRVACCHLIESLATGAAELYLSVQGGRADAQMSLEFLENILGCGKEHMYAAATAAYKAICDHVIASDEDWHIQVTKRILKGISRSPFFERQRGFALAAGACGDSSISGDVVTVLCRESIQSKDVEVRRNAVTSIGNTPIGVLQDRVVDILRSLTLSMQDYATDDRGDIGSWVREASMRSTSKVVASFFGESAPSYVEIGKELEEVLMNILRGIVEQCCSRIDRTRAVAGTCLKVFCVTIVPNDVNASNLSSVCNRLARVFGFHFAENGTDVGVHSETNFVETTDVFPVLREALHISEIRSAIMRGFISAAGGMGHQAKAACDAFVRHLEERERPSEKMEQLEEVVGVIACRDERLAMPALNLMNAILRKDVLSDVDESDLKKMVTAVKASWRQSLRNIKRIATAVSVISELASLSSVNHSFNFQEGSLGRECLEALVIVLGGPIPRLRRITAENIFMVLLEFDGLGGKLTNHSADEKLTAKVQAALDVLADTCWEQLDVHAARERRNSLCKLLNIRTPVAAKATASSR